MTDQLSEREFQSLPLETPSETGAEGEGGEAAGLATDEPISEESGGARTGRSRRGRRGGRRRRRSTGRGEESGESAETASEPDEPGAFTESATEDSEEEPGGAAGKKSRRRGRRGGRRRRKAGTGAPEEGAEESEDDSDEERHVAVASGTGEKADKAARKRRKRGSRGGRRKKAGAVSIESIPGDDDELPELAELPEETVLVESKGKAGKRSRGRSARKEDEDEERSEPSRPKTRRVILVNARDTEEKRVAVVEDGRIVDLQMTVRKHVSYVNDIYRGRVVNLETAIGAAFVDFGEGRNGFLHASDVLPSYGEADWSLEKLLSTPVEAESALPVAETVESGDDDEEEEEAEAPVEAPAGKAERSKGRSRPRVRTRMPIDKLLKKGQMVAVQITKDAIGDKGPTLTTYVSIPGRYLVLMPSLERTGVSRKIDDERERRRLKRILQSLEIPDGMGVIVRTAGVGRTKTELKRDLEYLLLAWEDFSKRLRSGRNPAPLYQESDVAIRTMRDLFTPETESVTVDDAEVYERMTEFTGRLMPEHLERVKLHDGARPIFHSHGVEQDFEKIFARRVELPSGGSIVIEQTEALVAIDVNSGRTREEGAEFEDIALKTNLEAAPEIARQIRLRDLGGIIVLDYIDMMRASSRKAVERATRECLKADRARTKIGRISQFGLLELTRQRLGPGLGKLVYDTCVRCRGSGKRRNASSRAQAIMRRLAAALALKGYSTVEVRAHPDAIDYLQKELKGELARMEKESQREIKLLAAPDQMEDSVLHYLRADGREVRPGGRRRR
jgi:ribonuclease E